MAEPDFSFLMPHGKPRPVVNTNKDRSLRGKARRKQRKEDNKISNKSGREDNESSVEEGQDSTINDENS